MEYQKYHIKKQSIKIYITFIHTLNWYLVSLFQVLFLITRVKGSPLSKWRRKEKKVSKRTKRERGREREREKNREILVKTDEG